MQATGHPTTETQTPCKQGSLSFWKSYKASPARRVIPDKATRQELIAFLIERDGNRCFYCDEPQSAYCLDHVQAKSRGGSDALSNRVLACGLCNYDKFSYPAWVFVLNREAGHTLAKVHTRMWARRAKALAPRTLRLNVAPDGSQRDGGS